jgi:mRNA interferase MazF
MFVVKKVLESAAMKVIDIKKVETVIETVEIGPCEAPPPRVSPRLKAAPKIRQLFWCDFPKDAQLPELWKCRAVLIVSYKNSLHSSVSVLPCSSADQTGNPWACKQATTIDGREDSWVLCDKITTVAVSRLSADRRGIIRVPEDEFNQALALLLEWIPEMQA